MKLISWNVNGLRACMNKGFADFMAEADADIFCVQETKMQREQATFDFPGYFEYWNSAEKKGYSGTAVFTKEEPLEVTYGLGIDEHDHEGRVITCQFPEFYLVNVYTPNSQDGLTRLAYRQVWEDAFLIRVQVAEGIGKAGGQQFRQLGPFFIGKARITSVGLPVFQINVVVGYV